MKTLLMIFGVCVGVVILGLNVATADMRNESANIPLKFSLDIDDTVIVPDLTFDTLGNVGSEAAQATCAATPGGTLPSGLLLESPVVPQWYSNRPEDYSRNMSPSMLAPLGSLAPPPSYRQNGRSSGSPNRYSPPNVVNPEVPPEHPTNEVPEPATWVIVGIGIGVAAVARRRWKNC